MIKPILEKMITDISNTDIVKILTVFSVSPGSRYTRNELKEKTFLNNVPLDKSLVILLNNQMLAKDKRYLSLNFENNNIRPIMEMLKREHIRFKELPLRIYFILLDISSMAAAIKNVTAMYLFGSYSKLIYTEKSDVDVAIITEEEDKSLIKQLAKSINKLEKKYHKDIELHFYEKKDLKQQDPIIKEILRNGIALFGKS